MSAFFARYLEPVFDFIMPPRIGLPQNVGRFGRWRRRWRLNQRREDYCFNYTHVSPLAIADSVPILDQVNFNWFRAVADKVLVALENRAALEMGAEAAQEHHDRRLKLHNLKLHGIEALEEIREHVHLALRFDGRVGAAATPAKALTDYAELFRAIGLPPIARDFQDDYAFADMRVAGPNPVMLERLTAPDDRFPITDALFQIAAPGDSLAAARAEARLYMADYAMLDGAEVGAFPNGQKYMAAPIALFVVDKKTRLLKPVAIQCQQKPGPGNPIFTPNDGWNWLIAKTFVEIADGNVHEALTHLGRTHLTMDPFVVASFRQLAPSHPLSHLLQPHFEGTLSINKAAWGHLIADKGAVEKLFSASIASARGLAVKGVQTLEVMNALLPRTFKARGVDDADALPNYPYRDDALLYWNAIKDWVKAYVDLYYTSAADVQQDTELQAWAREIASHEGGRVAGLPNDGSIQNVQELTDVLTFVIYTCSVQHAAVNFPQYDIMSYAPKMPLASYRPAPCSKDPATEADFLAMLPPLDMAELQLELGYMLGSIYYTELGKYDDSRFGKRVAPALQKFRQAVASAGTTIIKRNQQRPRPYTTLRPEGIPQSINI
jgi:arachidonate 15-lipoxygenase